MPERARVVRVSPGQEELIALARELFNEYQAWLGDIVCSYRLAEEIADLPGPYSPPRGRLMVAVSGDVPLGCIGIRPHEGESCEMKRLYVRPWARGRGVAQLLVTTAIDTARELGYQEVLLSTVPGSMDAARRVYRQSGFEPADPFRDLSHVADDTELAHMRLLLRAEPEVSL